MMNLNLASAAAVFALGFGVSAQAGSIVTLPPASFYSDIEYNDPSSGITRVIDNSSTSVGLNATQVILEAYQAPTLYEYTLGADVSSAPDPTVSTFAKLAVTYGANEDGSASDQASYGYWAVVNGPIGEQVPVELSYSVDVASLDGIPGEDVQSAQLGILANQPSALYDIPILGNYFYPDKHYSGVLYYTATAGTPFYIAADTSTYQNTPGSSSLRLDPLLSIDSSFASVDPNYLSDYSLQFSPGIGNTPVSEAPEPITWVLMSLGLGAVGGALRMHRRGKLAPVSLLTPAALKC